MSRRALVVRGGWEGHAPVETTELFIPGLREAGFDVVVSDDLDAYCDKALMNGADLIVQCWSRGTITPEQRDGLVDAVAAGTGFGGWHGGVVGTFTHDPRYLRLVGGLFLYHPKEFLRYDVTIDPAYADHPIVEGLPGFEAETEQYWMLTDPLDTVLAWTTVTGESGGHFGEAISMPVVWTRQWGEGRLFFSAVGHRVEDLEHPTVRELTLRGLIWAARKG